MEKVQEWYMERKKMSNDWIIEVQGSRWLVEGLCLCR